MLDTNLKRVEGVALKSDLHLNLHGRHKFMRCLKIRKTKCYKKNLKKFAQQIQTSLKHLQTALASEVV